MKDDAPLFELRNLSMSFAGVQALRDVSIQVRSGVVLCLLGDNGAGKSTLSRFCRASTHPPEAKFSMGRGSVLPIHATRARAE